jgi:hypothetical protein
MFDYSVTGKAAPTHPCARSIRSSLHIIDIRNWQAPPTTQNKEVAV